jgi:hypothetical protein
MAAVVFGVTTASHSLLHSIRLARIADVAIGVPAGALVFCLAASALGIAAIHEAREAMLRKLRRRLPLQR